MTVVRGRGHNNSSCNSLVATAHSKQQPQQVRLGPMRALMLLSSPNALVVSFWAPAAAWPAAMDNRPQTQEHRTAAVQHGGGCPSIFIA
jgi:hypothetical protein